VLIEVYVTRQTRDSNMFVRKETNVSSRPLTP
jgi:hypothetical protein